VTFPAYKDATASVRSSDFSLQPLAGNRLEHAGSDLGRGPTSVTLRRLRQAAVAEQAGGPVLMWNGVARVCVVFLGDAELK
jgi:hypothetical protein